jgi:hypothetical protein
MPPSRKLRLGGIWPLHKITCNGIIASCWQGYKEIVVKTNVHSPAFSTSELLELTGLTRRQLQQLEESGAVKPLRKGKQGRGHSGNWSVMQTVAAAYAKAFLEADCHPSWAYEACRWVAQQHPGALAVEFAQGRVLLALLPGGEGQLVKPALKPGATREHQLMVAQLDLQKVHDRVLRRADELVERLVGEEKAAGKVSKRQSVNPCVAGNGVSES